MPHIEKLSSPLNVSIDARWFDLNEEHHFWMRARFEEVQCVLPSNLEGKQMLEIGCGNGVFRSQMEQFSGAPIDGCDLNLRALEMAREGQGRLILYNILERNPELVGRYDLVFLMDVVEHIEDDAKFLEAALAHLKPGGTLILNVPFGPSLYSVYDKLIGHYRRYTKRQLLKVFSRLEADVIGLRCWGLMLVPLAVVRKMLLPLLDDDKKQIELGFRVPSRAMNRVFTWLLKLERQFAPLRFIGASVILVATKR